MGRHFLVCELHRVLRDGDSSWGILQATRVFGRGFRGGDKYFFFRPDFF